MERSSRCRASAAGVDFSGDAPVGAVAAVVAVSDLAGQELRHRWRSAAEDVVTCFAEETVLVVTASEIVVAGTAPQGVPAGGTDQLVVTVVTVEPITAGATEDPVVACSAPGGVGIVAA
jgi:hypothetical protein